MGTRPHDATRRRTARWTRRGARVGALGGLAITAAIAAIAATAAPAAGNGWTARAVLRDATGAKVATVKFEGDEHGTIVKVVAHEVTVGQDAFHGLHVHANPDGAPCDPTVSFSTVGGHWTSPGTAHGHHLGDLPSLLVQADGTASARSVTGRFEPGELVGKAVILHAGPDNFANIPGRYSSTDTPTVPGPDATTIASGDAGGRFACGIITLD